MRALTFTTLFLLIAVMNAQVWAQHNDSSAELIRYNEVLLSQKVEKYLKQNNIKYRYTVDDDNFESKIFRSIVITTEGDSSLNQLAQQLSHNYGNIKLSLMPVLFSMNKQLGAKYINYTKNSVFLLDQSIDSKQRETSVMHTTAISSVEQHSIVLPVRDLQHFSINSKSMQHELHHASRTLNPKDFINFFATANIMVLDKKNNIAINMQQGAFDEVFVYAGDIKRIVKELLRRKVDGYEWPDNDSSIHQTASIKNEYFEQQSYDLKKVNVWVLYGMLQASFDMGLKYINFYEKVIEKLDEKESVRMIEGYYRNGIQGMSYEVNHKDLHAILTLPYAKEKIKNEFEKHAKIRVQLRLFKKALKLYANFYHTTRNNYKDIVKDKKRWSEMGYYLKEVQVPDENKMIADLISKK